MLRLVPRHRQSVDGVRQHLKHFANLRKLAADGDEIVSDFTMGCATPGVRRSPV